MQRARLVQLLSSLLLAVLILSAAEIIMGVLFSSLIIGMSGVLILCFGFFLLLARRQASRDKLQEAIRVLCTSFFIVSILSALAIPSALPVCVLGPIVAIAISLPYVDGRTLRGLLITAWAVTIAATVLAQIVVPIEIPDPQLVNAINAGSITLVIPILLWLLWQYHTRLSESLAQVLGTNSSLQTAMATAQEAHATAEQANQLKSQFLASMSHELRTPLNSIINFTRILSTGMRGPVNEEQLDYLNRVRMSGEHLLGLINDVLDLSKIEAGRMELLTEPLQVSDIVQGVMVTAAGLIKAKPIELCQEIAANLPLVQADRTRLRQILLNLLSNAAKFTERGTITVRASQEDGFLVLSVADTGIGIATEHLASVFEEFRQIDAMSNRRYEGTGLGLAICRRLVELHGGRIWAESTLRVGTTFSFTLPALAAPQHQTAILIAPARDGIPILVIDDDPSAIEIVAAYLEPEEYAVYGVTDSRLALEEARLIQPQAILLDVLMPHKDGWEVLAELKADSFLRGIPVALYTIVDEQKLGFYLGASAYLTKPLDAEELRATAARLVGGDATVLVIDDDADAREIVTRQLQSAGPYRVMAAGGGQAGLDQIAVAAPDLIILDLMMPEVDGFAVLAQLDGQPRTRDIPVIVLTAKDLTAREHEALNQRVDGLLLKGLTSPDQLLSKVNTMLGGAQRQRCR
jgi:signal transduction histidine kinase/CheY-like chemotaxis protein